MKFTILEKELGQDLIIQNKQHKKKSHLINKAVQTKNTIHQNFAKKQKSEAPSQQSLQNIHQKERVYQQKLFEMLDENNQQLTLREQQQKLFKSIGILFEQFQKVKETSKSKIKNCPKNNYPEKLLKRIQQSITQLFQKQNQIAKNSQLLSYCQQIIENQQIAKSLEKKLNFELIDFTRKQFSGQLSAKACIVIQSQIYEKLPGSVITPEQYRQIIKEQQKFIKIKQKWMQSQQQKIIQLNKNLMKFKKQIKDNKEDYKKKKQQKKNVKKIEGYFKNRNPKQLKDLFNGDAFIKVNKQLLAFQYLFRDIVNEKFIEKAIKNFSKQQFHVGREEEQKKNQKNYQLKEKWSQYVQKRKYIQIECFKAYLKSLLEYLRKGIYPKQVRFDNQLKKEQIQTELGKGSHRISVIFNADDVPQLPPLSSVGLAMFNIEDVPQLLTQFSVKDWQFQSNF